MSVGVTKPTDGPPISAAMFSSRLRLPGLIPREPGLETYWVRPGGVTEIGRAHV